MSTINATTLKATTLQHTNGTTALNIDTTGRVTLPNQPGFLATGSFSSPSGSSVRSYSSVPYNIGNHYNNTNGVFTCPLTGKYLATASFLSNVVNNYTLFNFYLNSSLYTSGWHQAYNYSVATGQCLTASMVIFASTNDTIDLRFNSTYNTPYTPGYSYISINLL